MPRKITLPRIAYLHLCQQRHKAPRYPSAPKVPLRHTPGPITAPSDTARQHRTRKAYVFRCLETFRDPEGRPGTGELDSGKG